MSGTQVNMAEIEVGLVKVIDPKLGRPFTEVKLIDGMTAEGVSSPLSSTLPRLSVHPSSHLR
jgi:hypothetical protein